MCSLSHQRKQLRRTVHNRLLGHFSSSPPSKVCWRKGTPVRVGVLDGPVGMFVQDRKLIAHVAGGHTTLIVGCDKAASTFMYIDTWPGGSKLKYQGGIPGPGAPKDPCLYMGLFNTECYFTRSLKNNSSAPNLLRQDRNTEGNFNTGRENYLEIVSGPIPKP
jgi:hypothetical protein